MNKPPLTTKQILAWADEHHRRTGCWPSSRSGHIPGTNRETWRIVDSCLFYGCRGWPGGSSLRKLLLEHRGASARSPGPNLTMQQILAWADAHHERTGRWPNEDSGPVHEIPGESWRSISKALRQGLRGLPGGTTLHRLLRESRGARSAVKRAPLTIPQILAWADAHYQRTGRWPTMNSGRVHRVPKETWSGIYFALRNGLRGFPPGSSLFRLLAEHRGIPRYR
jgi:hypothetical protein